MKHVTTDRRRHKRVKVDRSVLKSSEYSAQDLSESGMQLSCDSERRKGRKIELTLTLNAETFNVSAEVMWCKKASSIYESGFHIGVQFVGHSIHHQLIIREFVESKS